MTPEERGHRVYAWLAYVLSNKPSEKRFAENEEWLIKQFAEAVAEERERLADLIDRRARYLRSINATGSAEEWRSSDWWQGLEEASNIVDGIFIGKAAPPDDDDIALQYG